jgi:hypothetical protein
MIWWVVVSLIAIHILIYITHVVLQYKIYSLKNDCDLIDIVYRKDSRVMDGADTFMSICPIMNILILICLFIMFLNLIVKERSRSNDPLNRKVMKMFLKKQYLLDRVSKEI